MGEECKSKRIHEDIDPWPSGVVLGCLEADVAVQGGVALLRLPRLWESSHPAVRLPVHLLLQQRVPAKELGRAQSGMCGHSLPHKRGTRDAAPTFGPRRHTHCAG